MTSVLPDYLKPIATSYSETPSSAVRRTQFEDGYIAQKQHLSRQLISKSITCLVKGRDNRTAFKEWFRSIGRGQDWFIYYDPDDLEEVEARIVNGAYTINSLSADVFHISFNIEIYE